MNIKQGLHSTQYFTDTEVTEHTEDGVLEIFTNLSTFGPLFVHGFSQVLRLGRKKNTKTDNKRYRELQAHVQRFNLKSDY